MGGERLKGPGYSLSCNKMLEVEEPSQTEDDNHKPKLCWQ